MNRRIYALPVLVLLAVFTIPCRAETAPASARQTLTGTVSCSARMNGMYLCRRSQTPQSCTLDCVSQGFNYVLSVDGQNAVQLQGNAEQLAKFAGGKAKVSGVAAPDGTRLEVVSVSNAK
jgi:hypothetical protein